MWQWIQIKDLARNTKFERVLNKGLNWVKRDAGVCIKSYDNARNLYT